MRNQFDNAGWGRGGVRSRKEADGRAEASVDWGKTRLGAARQGGDAIAVGAAPEAGQGGEDGLAECAGLGAGALKRLDGGLNDDGLFRGKGEADGELLADELEEGGRRGGERRGDGCLI